MTVRTLCDTFNYFIYTVSSTIDRKFWFTCSSEPSVVTMVTVWEPCDVSSCAGMVMVVPSWVTMVIVPPMACRSASEMLT